MEYVGTKEAARRTGRPWRTIRYWCLKGKFPGAIVTETLAGSAWAIPEKELALVRSTRHEKTPAR